ncbi:MAG: hypothetical protein ABI192_02640 [Bradyrhizobium sp.]
MDESNRRSRAAHMIVHLKISMRRTLPVANRFDEYIWAFVGQKPGNCGIEGRWATTSRPLAPATGA